jgi:hypothetical protein
MKTMRSLPILASMLLVAGSAFPKAGNGAVEKIYQLALTGDDGASFAGRCKLETAGGQTVIRLDGQVPHERELVGQSLSCKLKTRGGVVVDVEHNGNRSRSATNGGTVNINLR